VRIKKLAIVAVSTTHNGENSTFTVTGSDFTVTGSDSKITATDIVLQKSIFLDAIGNNPYGNIVNMPSDATVTEGSAAAQYSKCATMPGTTTSVMTLIVAGGK